ncbi:unnamed protein product [Closterium sp. NIES-54]
MLFRNVFIWNGKQDGGSGDTGPVAPPCSCRLLLHQTLLWHRRLGHPSLPRLRGMHSRLLLSGLPRSLPPLPPSPAPPCLPCVEGRQRAAPHSSSFPPTTAPLQTLRMDVWGPTRVSEQDPRVRSLVSWSLGSAQSVSSSASVMEVARTSIIHAAAPHFLWPFATSLTLRWLGKVGNASVFRVWGYRAFVRDASADKLSTRAIPSVFLGFPPDAPGWQFYHPTSHHVLPSQDVTFDESVPFYGLFPYRSAPLPPPPLFLAPRPPPVDPLPPQGPAPSGAARGAASGDVEPGRAEPGGAELAGAEPGDAESQGVGSGGAEPGGAEPGGAEPEGAEPGGAESEGAESGGTEPRGTASSGGPAAASLGGAGVLARARGPGGAGAAGPGGARTRGTGAAGAGTGAVDPGARGTGSARVGGVGGNSAGGAGAGDTRAGGTGAGSAGARGARAGDPSAGGAGAVDPGAGGAGAGGAASGGTGAGGTMQRRSFFVAPSPSSLLPPDSVLRQVLSLPSSTGLPPSLLSPPTCQSQPQLQPDSPLLALAPYAEQTDSFTERCEPDSPVHAVRTGRWVPRPCRPSVPSTLVMALDPSSVPLRIPVPPHPESSLPAVPDPESYLARAASPTVTRLLATVVTHPSFESTAASTLVAELVDFVAACRLDYTTSLVADSESDYPPSIGGECALGTDVLEDRQEDFECLAATLPHLVAMLLAPEGDPDAPDIPTSRSYAEAITGPYSSKRHTAMDAEIKSWKSTGTYVDTVPPYGANISATGS